MSDEKTHKPVQKRRPPGPLTPEEIAALREDKRRAGEIVGRLIREDKDRK
ncbi:MAG TPA: hypothetical protein VGH91_12140 [Gammaproteobacteria bacterium]|jgi:hypothetical protein